MVSKKSPSGSLLNTPKPEAKLLNKKLIIGIAAIFGVVVLLIISLAFSNGPSPQVNSGIEAPSSVGVDSSALNVLPSGYQDGQAIQSILSRGQPKSSDTALLAQLSELQHQQVSLEQQLSQLQGGSNPAQSNADPMQREAMTSSIFFAGGAPAPNQQPPQTADQAAAKKALTANDSKPTDPYAAQNAQGQKVDFLSSKPSKDIYNTNSVQYPISKYQLQAGTVIPAILQTELNTDLPGTIVAVVRQNVYDSVNGQYLLVPKGSKLIGEYSSTVTYGQSSLQAKFTRLIRPDGTSIVLPAGSGGVNQMGVTGFSDEVNNHWGAIIGAGVLMAVFNIPSIIATNQMNASSNQNCQTNPDTNIQTCTSSNGSTLNASAWQSVGQASASLGNAIAQRSLNIQPTIIINAGYQFAVIVTKDIVLPPYTPVMEDIPELGN